MAQGILAKYFLWTKAQENRQKPLIQEDFPVPLLLGLLVSHCLRSSTRLIEFDKVKVLEVLEHRGGQETETSQWGQPPLCTLEMSGRPLTVNDSLQLEVSRRGESVLIHRFNGWVSNQRKTVQRSQHRLHWSQSTAFYEMLQTLKVLHDCANHNW